MKMESKSTQTEHQPSSIEKRLSAGSNNCTFISTRGAAQLIGVSPKWLREHHKELGLKRIGTRFLVRELNSL